MEKLIKSIEGVHPGKYDLRRNELDELYDAYHHDTFKLIAVVFKLGLCPWTEGGEEGMNEL